VTRFVLLAGSTTKITIGASTTVVVGDDLVLSRRRRGLWFGLDDSDSVECSFSVGASTRTNCVLTATDSLNQPWAAVGVEVGLLLDDAHVLGCCVRTIDKQGDVSTSNASQRCRVSIRVPMCRC
jgi:hypothetical protein